MKSEFIFTLATSIKIHTKDGQEETCFELKLLAPSYKQREHCLNLKQEFTRIITKMQDKNSDTNKNVGSDDKDPTGEDIYNIFLMSDKPMSESMNKFDKLLTSGICFALDQEVKKFNIEQMSMEDQERLFGEYFVNFLIPSLMKNSGKT